MLSFSRVNEKFSASMLFPFRLFPLFDVVHHDRNTVVVIRTMRTLVFSSNVRFIGTAF